MKWLSVNHGLIYINTINLINKICAIQLRNKRDWKFGRTSLLNVSDIKVIKMSCLIKNNSALCFLQYETSLICSVNQTKLISAFLYCSAGREDSMGAELNCLFTECVMSRIWCQLMLKERAAHKPGLCQ